MDIRKMGQQDINISDAQTVSEKKFQHKSFEERLREYDGKISVCAFDWGEPQGREI